MSNPKFLGVDLTVPTYTWSAGVDTSYPVSNLKTYYPDQLSISNATTADQYFLIDFGAAVSCNCLVISGHNFNLVADTNIKLQVNTSDDTNFVPDAEDVATLWASGGASLTGTDAFTFAAVSKRYWRILFTSTIAVKPQIGNIFLGTSLDFTKPQQFNFYTNHPSNNTAKVRALDGRLRTAQTFGAIRKHKASFKLLTDAFVALYKTFLSTVGNDGLPFYYIDKDSAIYLVNLEKGFNPYDAFRYNLNDITDLAMESTMADT